MNAIRRQAREAAMQRLFEMEMAGSLGGSPEDTTDEKPDTNEDAPAVVVELRTDDDTPEAPELSAEDRDFANRAADAAQRHAEDVDAAIEKSLIRWTLERLSRVDLAILRLAVVEIEYLKTPPKIAINEAVELAKKYSGDKAHQFVNGVLAGYLKGRSS